LPRVSRLKTSPQPPAVAGMPFARQVVSPVPGGALVQQVVHSVFFTVVSVVTTLLTMGLTGVIILLVTNGDTPQADSRHGH
jgi:hypothetical protein